MFVVFHYYLSRLLEEVLMKSLKMVITLAVISIVYSTALADFVPLRTDIIGDKPEIEMIKHDADQVQFEVRIAGIELSEGIIEGRYWDRVHIPGGAYGLEKGMPEVPFFSKMLAIPPTTAVRVEFEPLEIETITGIELMPSQGDEPEQAEKNAQPIRFDMAAYSQDAFYPAEEAVSGDPGLMRGLRVVPIIMRPVRYNPVTQELRIAHRFRVTVHFEGTDLRNTPTRSLRPISRDYYKVLAEVVMNLDELDMEIIPMGSYLIVCENNLTLLTDLEPLIDWKIRKGHTVVVSTFSGGASATTIKNLIQTAYNTWEIPPEYVLLWGDHGGEYALPCYDSYYGLDHAYSQLDGGDILADVAVGRFPAQSQYQTLVMRNKILYYEKMPYIGNDDWYHQGVLVAGSYSSGLSTILVNRYIKTRMIWREYTRIDTFWYTGCSGSVVSTLTNGINDGALYVNYRGWIGMEGFGTSNISALTNVRMLPFVTILTCGTGGFNTSSESRMERFSNVGTPLAPTGAIACVGTATSSTHTKYLNSVSNGMYDCVYDMNVPRPGLALVNGKQQLYNGYHITDPTQVSNFSKWANLAGDPGTQLFTHAIQYMDCSVPSAVSFGENALTLTVNELGVGPLEDALVCLYAANEMHEVGYTDMNGMVTLPIEVRNPENVKVTITKQNFFPIVDSLDVVQADVAVGYFDHAIDDDSNGSSSGDGDGILNPGEDIEIPLILKNYGNSVSATGISVTASESDEYAALGDAYETFGNLAPSGTGSSDDDFDLSVASDCPHGHIVHLDLTVDSDQGTWDALLDLEVVSFEATITSAYAFGADTLLTPGETANFIVVVENTGGKTAASLTATMTSLSSFVTVDDNHSSYGTITPGTSASNFSDPFILTAIDESPPGYEVDLEIVFTSGTGATQTEIITIPLGIKTSVDPQGPDECGYFCFDNTDLDYATAPAYNWVEIDPSYGGSGTQLPIIDLYEEDDMSVNVLLPFTFRYYGEDVGEITVCSNGWISTWPNISFANFRNWPIPSSLGPNGMIAAFWDDLLTWSGGHVYAYNDVTNHRFIIEWSRVKTYHSPSPQETFEIILYDPAYYPTPTGDGEILFQYHTIVEVQGNVGTYSGDNGYSTIGIERPDKHDGIEVVYWDMYDDPATAEVENGRAYLFTTNFEYGVTPGEFDVQLTYQSGSPVPAGGGNIYFDIYVENVGASAVNFDAWLAVEYEGNQPTTVVLRSFANYQPGWAINRSNMYFPVPAGYAAGNYELYCRVGDEPNTVWNESGFPFIKSGTDYSSKFQPFVPDGMPNPFDEIITAGSTLPVPEEYSLLGVYPNPFNPVSLIRFALPSAGRVTLEVFDVTGRTVARLLDGYLDAGVHEARFDASGFSSGIYIYRLNASDFSATGKMVLMK